MSQHKHYLVLVLFAVFPANGLIINVGRDWTLLQLTSIILLCSTLLDSFIKDQRLVINKGFFVWSVTFIMAASISIVFKPEDPNIVFNTTSKYYQSYAKLDILYTAWMILNFLTVIIIYNHINTENKFYKVLRVILYSSVFYALYAFYQYFMVLFLGEDARSLVYVLKEDYLWGPEAIRSPSLSREPLFYSFYLISVILLCTSLLYKGSKEVLTKVNVSTTRLIIILLMNVMSFFTGRPTAGFIALICSIVFLVYKYWKFSWRLSIKSLKTLGLSLGIALAGLGGFLYLNFDRIERRLTRASDINSNYMRLVSILEGVEFIKKYPITGYGISNSQFFVSTVVIHNMYVSLLAEIGIIGFLTFLVFLVILWIKLSRISVNSKMKFFGVWMLCILISILIQWLSFHAYSLPEFWVIVGLSLCIIKIDYEAKPDIQVRI